MYAPTSMSSAWKHCPPWDQSRPRPQGTGARAAGLRGAGAGRGTEEDEVPDPWRRGARGKSQGVHVSRGRTVGVWRVCHHHYHGQQRAGVVWASASPGGPASTLSENGLAEEDLTQQ